MSSDSVGPSLQRVPSQGHRVAGTMRLTRGRKPNWMEATLMPVTSAALRQYLSLQSMHQT